MINGISAYAFSSIPGGPGKFGFNPETVAYVGKMATLGGVEAELQGGKFGHGFLSSGLSAVAGGAIGGNPTIARALGKEGRFIASIVAGGTISELTGGNFANGAITAAFAYVAGSAAQARAERLADQQYMEQAFAQAEAEGVFSVGPDAMAVKFPVVNLHQGLVDFSAGFGDGIFLGGTRYVRDWLGIDGGIDPNSNLYGAGYASGFTVTSSLVTRGVTQGFRSQGPLRILNHNRNFRIGYGAHQGRSTSRLGGRTVESVTSRKHIDLGDGGPL